MATINVNNWRSETTQSKDTVMCKNPSTEVRSGESNTFQSFQDTHESIDFHWEAFSVQSKEFILLNIHELTLNKLVSFWSSPRQREREILYAAGLASTSWLLALKYLNQNKLAEAKSLIINGGFLHQCSVVPIDNIIELCRDSSDTSKEVVLESLPHFRHAYFANLSLLSMERYLKSRLPSEYQSIMSFASHRSKGGLNDFVNNISSDWNSGGSYTKQRNLVDDGDCNKITIIFKDPNELRKLCIGVSNTMKSLFNEYADKRGISLRSLRLTYADKTLFLSAVGNKSPSELGMNDLDVIHVRMLHIEQEGEASQSDAAVAAARSRKSAKKNRKKRATKGKGKTKTKSCLPDYKSKEDCIGKIAHSRALTRLFEEADPKFKEIRQKLDSQNLKRCEKKDKTKMFQADLPVHPVPNPPMYGLGGKAGKSRFTVLVGDVNNLYKTIKPSRLRNLGCQTPHTITLDLHGCTRGEALTKLDSGLLEWNEIAMMGHYPWVIPVTIVCGGGNQILSEAVGNWIKLSDKVAKSKNVSTRQRKRQVGTPLA